jgi:hypothetical protein
MASPVFVCDSQGHPLMPMAPAYARKLLHQGKARWLPHHAFTRIQLKQTIPTPILQPTRLVISLHQKVAECFLLMEGLQGVLPLLHLLVDLQLPDVIKPYTRKRQRTGPTILPNHYRSPGRVNIRYSLEAIIQTTKALNNLIPVNDVVLLPSIHSARLKHFVHHRASFMVPETPKLWWPDEVAFLPMTASMSEALKSFMDLPAQYATSFVVTYLPEPPLNPSRGCLCDSHYHQHSVRGLLTQRTRGGKPTLLVPYASRRPGCVWRRIKPNAPVHIRSQDNVCFIPLKGISSWRKKPMGP